MPRLSTLSNPTGLVEIDRNRISIVVDESGKQLAFSLARLDLDGLNLQAGLHVVVIARRGNSEERLELGSVLGWDKSYKKLNEIAEEGIWTFRVLLVVPGNSKLVGAAENVRPTGHGDSSSFIALEAADLGQHPWEIYIEESDGRAVIRFNKTIYMSPAEADADKFFVNMILPEALRRVAEWVAEHPACLEEPCWEPFKNWLLQHGITDDPEEDHEEEWCSEVVQAFCDRFEFATQLQELRAKREEE